MTIPLKNCFSEILSRLDRVKCFKVTNNRLTLSI